MMIPPVLLVGCGRMGGAMLAGWRERGLAASVAVDPALPEVGPGLTVVAEAADIPAGFRPEAVVLAVKPQTADTVLPAYARFGQDAVFLSIMAGRMLGGMSRLLGDAAPVVRAMPNTPASIRQAITVAFAGPGVSARHHRLCDTLLRAMGEVAWVEDEALLAPVTALSGGGPAYVFLLVELLAKAGVEQGLAPDLAGRLARQTVIGAAGLLAAGSEDPAGLRRAVTSPKGTTERALAVLMAEEAWPASLSRAIAAATARARELAGA